MFRIPSVKNVGVYKAGARMSSPGPKFVLDAFDPSNIAGLGAWYKADSLVLANGASVSSFADSSGNGKTLVSTGTAPLFYTSSINGKPGLRFNGTGGLYKSSLGLSFVSGSSIFIVGNWAGTAANCGIIAMNTTGNDYDPGEAMVISSGYSGGNACGYSQGWRGVAYSNVTTTFNANAIWQTSVSNVGSGNINQVNKKNGIQLESKTNAGSANITPTNMTLGVRLTPSLAAPYLVGDISEVIVYTNFIGTTNEDLVLQYLKTKYAL